MGLRDCTLAEVTTSDDISRLADIATARALSASVLGRSVEDPAGDPAGDPGAADPGDAKFAALHARRGDELAWCDTSRGALDDFVECALANATDRTSARARCP